jgi:outer membrane protein TolC
MEIKYSTICAIVVLGLGGWGSGERVLAKSLNITDARRDLQLPQSQPNGNKFGQKLLVQNTIDAPVTSNNVKLQNDLNLPKTGTDVQITNTKSLTLAQAIETAFRNNRDVQVAQLTVDKNTAGIRVTQAAQSVQVGLTGGLQNQGSPLLFGTQTTTSNSTNVQGKLSATYTLLDAGLNSGNVRAAQEQVNFDRLDLVRVEQKVRGDVITAYYDLQAADSSVIINRAAVKDAARSLSDAQLQEKAGMGTKFDVLTAEVSVGTANQNLTTALSTQQTARKNLAQLLVADNNTEFTAADAVRELGSWGYSLEDSIVLAYKNRPEIQQKLVSRSISAAQQIVAAAADAPQVSLFANYSLNQSLSNSSSALDDYSVGAQLSWSFWDGGAARANVDKQKFSQEIFENNFTTQRNAIRYEIERAYYGLGSNQKNIVTATQALNKAEESLKLARLRFQAGVGTQTDVIRAQTDLATARGNRITAIINYNRDLSRLRVATVLAD